MAVSGCEFADQVQSEKLRQ